MTVPERNMQQVINRWNKLAIADTHDTYGDGRMKYALKSCADEASVLLEREQVQIKEWREAAARGKEAAANADTLLSRETIHARVQIYEKCADAIEQIIGPMPNGGGKK